MADPIDILMSEHRIIEKVLDALESGVERDMPASFYERAIEFLRTFADACHHGKEEARLFPALEARGMPREMGPIGVMCHEHVVGRGHIQRMAEYLRLGNRQGLRHATLAYVELLRSHIEKEDQVLFMMARHTLSEPDVARLTREFAEADAGARPQERWGAVAEKLLAEARGR